MERPHAIHFAASHLHWLTRAEGSHGFFQLDSLLEWLPAASQKPLQFVLAAAVPAGRVYAPEGPLLKQPPYSFQLIAGPNEHTIAQIKEATRDGLRAVKNVYDDKAVVPGAGSFEVACSVHLNEYCK